MNDLLFSVQLSLLVASVSTLLVAVCGSGIGYLLARHKFPGDSILDALCTLPLVLPPTVVGYYLLFLFSKSGVLGKTIFEFTGWSLVFTWQAAVLAAFVISLPLMIKSSKAAFESVDPELEQVAYTLGKSELETIFKVTVPLAARGLIAGLALSFARALGEFGATLMIAGNIPNKTQTMPLLIFQATQAGESNLVFVLVLCLSAFSFLLLLLLNKWGARW